MTFKTPAFWYIPDYRLPKLLRLISPLGAIYGWGTALRQKMRHPIKVGVPVVCVGNLVAGGSGKTPVAMALLSLIKDSGVTQNPCFLTRGYGGTLTGPVFVSKHSYHDVGDEALLLSRVAPTIVAKDRVAGARLAAASGYDMIIMDDGFQNPSLQKTGFVVVDGLTGFGNGYMIPFGPLREPVAAGLARAKAIIQVGGGATLDTTKPVIQSHYEVTSSLTVGERVYAFCGLGQPEKFRKTLHDLGVELAGFQTFSDHHPYSDDDLKNLHAKAFENKARLVTTEKDLCRLPSAENIMIIKIKLVFDQPDLLLSLIQEAA